jgi:hypothetical protein
LNINTLNNNNNVYDSVVTPPRMADLSLWISAEHSATSGGTDVTDAFDRSPVGNHLTQATTVNCPQLTVATDSTLFGGKKVLGLDQEGGPSNRDETFIQNDDADFENIFGTSASPITDPEFTVALVVNKTDTDVGTRYFFTIDEDTSGAFDYFRVSTNSNGAGFLLFGDADTADTGDQVYAEGTPVTVITVVSDVGSSMEVHQWVGGVVNIWDSAGSATIAADPNQMFISGNDTNVTLGGDKLGNTGDKCDIAEVLVWKGAHTVAERTETLNYLRDRWDCS